MTDQPKEHSIRFLTRIKNFLVDRILNPIITLFKNIAALFTSTDNDLTETHNENIVFKKDLSKLNDKIQKHFETRLYMLKQQLNSEIYTTQKTKLNDEIKKVKLIQVNILQAYNNKNMNQFMSLVEKYLNNIQAMPNNIKKAFKFSVDKKILDYIEDVQKLEEGPRLHAAIIKGNIAMVKRILSEGSSFELTYADNDNKTALQIAFSNKANNNDKYGVGTKILDLILAAMEELDRKLDKAIDQKEDPTTIYNLIPQNENIIIYALREKNDKLFYYMMEHYNEFKYNENTPHANEPPSYYETMTADPDKIKALKEIKVLKEIKRSNDTRFLY